MTVSVITDSAASLTPELADHLGVVVVPMLITVEGRTVTDDELRLEDLVELLDRPLHTSGPPPGAFEEAIESSSGDEGALVLTVSQRMSSTHKSALLGAQAAGRAAVVVDTATAAGAEGLVVIAAARAAAEGLGLESVAARARAVAERVRLVAAVDSLDHLVRGGRLPEIAGRAGNHLGVRALFSFASGRIRPLRPSLSAGGALEQLVSYWRRTKVGDAALHLAALHAMNPDGATWLLEQVSAEVQPADAFVGTFGPVMVAHTGPGVTGLAWWWEQA